MDEYNYADFDIVREDQPFVAFKGMLPVGDRAPSFALEDARSGETVQMRSLWKNGPAILEFGSFT